MIRWLVVSFLLLSVSASAAELYQDGETIRSLGMGGVRVSNPHDAQGFLANPAALAYIDGINLQLFEADVGINGSQTISDFNHIKNFQGLSDLQGYYGHHYWAGARGTTAFALPYIGFAVQEKVHLDMTLNNPSYPTLDMNYVTDRTYNLGLAIPFTGLGNFGVNAKRVTRKGGQRSLGPSFLNQSNLVMQDVLDQFDDEGTGYGFDLGWMYQAPVPLHPTLSVSYQDVGGTHFKLTQGTIAPDMIPENLTVGASVRQNILLGGLTAGLEYRHLTQTDEPMYKKLQAGLELNLANVDLRAGFSQGYPTYGAGFDFWIFRLDGSVYTVEQGAYAGQSPDTRWEVGLSMSFSFDPPGLSWLTHSSSKNSDPTDPYSDPSTYNGYGHLKSRR